MVGASPGISPVRRSPVPVRTVGGPHAAVRLLGLLMVVLWFVGHFQTSRRFVADPGPWYRHEKCFSFSDMPAAARRSHFEIRLIKKADEHVTLPKFNAARSTRQTRHTGSPRV